MSGYRFLTVGGYGLAALTLALAAMSPAEAGTAQRATGCYASADHSKVMSISENHTFILIDSDGMGIITDDRSSPLFGVAGPCYGTVEIKDGKVHGSGYCLRTDPDQDKLLISWEVTGIGEGGRFRGNWTLSGLSGKWVGASGKGTFQYQKSAFPDRSINCFEGELTMAR
ncbi:MAG: hypothetical protein HY347_04540 [candidate division NC10 bacterium]|nr:hypothetical protein [candidate division NC10 bacterium]